jgi:hypothetical protein
MNCAVQTRSNGVDRRAVTIDSWCIEGSLLELAFCGDQRIRVRVSAVLLRALPKPAADVEEFVKLSIIKIP